MPFKVGLVSIYPSHLYENTVNTMLKMSKLTVLSTRHYLHIYEQGLQMHGFNKNVFKAHSRVAQCCWENGRAGRDQVSSDCLSPSAALFWMCSNN